MATLSPRAVSHAFFITEENQVLHSSLIQFGIAAGIAIQTAEGLSTDIELITEAKWVDKICKRFSSAHTFRKKQADSLQELYKNIKKLEKSTSDFFLQGLQEAADRFTHSENSLKEAFQKGFSLVQSELDTKIQNTWEQLSAFRAAPTEEAIKKLSHTLIALPSELKNLTSLSERCSISLDAEQENYIQCFQEMLCLLASLIDPQSQGLSPLFNRVSIVLHTKESLSPEEQKALEDSFNKAIPNHFSEKMQNDLDEAIYELAPQPKGGESWGKIHRYHDWRRFKEAFTTIAYRETKKQLEEERFTREEIEDFYVKLHELGFGPYPEETTKMISWAQNEISTLLSLVPHACAKVIQRRISVESHL